MYVRYKPDGQVITLHEFRVLFQHEGVMSIPNLSEEYINGKEYDIVFEGPQATPTNQYEYSMQQGIEQKEDGKWYTKYVLGPIFTDTEEASAADQEAAYRARKDAEHAIVIRNTRNQKLRDCDWTQVADAPIDKTAWANYRQALRDITTQTGFPWNVQWPDQPE